MLKHTVGIAPRMGGVLVALMAWLRSYSQPSAQREVPNVVSLGREEATQTLSALGLEAVWQDSIYAAQGHPERWWNNIRLPGVPSKRDATSS